MDREVVLEAVQQHGLALQYASDTRLPERISLGVCFSEPLDLGLRFRNAAHMPWLCIPKLSADAETTCYQI